MSIAFNDTENFKGIVQQYEKEIDAHQGDVSGSTQALKEFTAEANIAFDEFLSIAIPASGTMQYDDSNHDDYPFIKTNIVSGQRDYSYLQDESGNFVLDIYKVAILQSADATEYQELDPMDVQSDPNLAARFNNNATGVPAGYDKTGNGIIFDAIPNYSADNGLLLYVNREASYFRYDDTTKRPGVPGLFHRWFAIRPAENYARRKGLANYALLRDERMQMERDIKAHFGRRERDVRHRITNRRINSR